MISYGNTKLPKTTAIFNMTSAKDCPTRALGMCKICNAGRQCYALKAERLYPQVLPYRKRQAAFWAGNTASALAKFFVHELFYKKHKHRITALRFNESGDLRGPGDLDKINRIARELAPHGIVVYFYTARLDIIAKYTTPLEHNIVIQGSGFMAHNKFKAVSKDYKLQGQEVFCPGDCRICKLCLERGQRVIVNVYH
jgi:hypothetical protein